jgi:uncharacterized protein (TIGR02996 family)
VTDLQALAAAVLAAPADDLPRLVLADALDETGRAADAARAELIRLQCTLATLGEHTNEKHNDGVTGGEPGGCRICVLRKRQHQLLKKWAAKWLSRPLRPRWLGFATDGGIVTLRGVGADYAVFDRGFVARLGVQLPWRVDEQSAAVEAFAAAVARCWPAAPLEGLSVSFAGAADFPTLHVELRPSEGDRPRWVALFDDETFRGLCARDAATAGIERPGRAELGRDLADWLGAALGRAGAAATRAAADVADGSDRREFDPPDPEVEPDLFDGIPF